MIKLGASIVIYKSPQQVFDFVSAPGNDFEWQYGTLGAGQISTGRTALGASFRTVGHLMGRRMQRTFEVTDYEENSRFGFKSISGPLESRTLYTLQASKGSTRFEVSTEAMPVDAMVEPEGKLQKRMQKQLQEDLALLKSLLESDADHALVRPQ